MKRWIYAAVPALAFASLIGWRLDQKRDEAGAQKQQRAARAKAPLVVEVAAATRRDLVQTYGAVGSVESPESVALTPKIAGRILFLAVDEGDRVQAGQVLARLDGEEVEAGVRQKQAVLAQARSRLAEARLTESPASIAVGTEVRRQQAAVATARAQARQARADENAQIGTAQATVTAAQGRIDSAAADIASAEAAIRTAEANLANARTRLARLEALHREGAVSAEVRDNARTEVSVREGALGEARQRRQAAVAARDSAVAQKRAAEKQVEVVRNKARADIAATEAGVAQARAGLLSAQANTARRPAYAQNLAALEAAVRAAEADLRAAEARRTDTVLRAPLTGVVTERNLDTGALAAPSQPILTVQAVRQVWVSVAVPEEVSRRVYQGQAARVTLDALPGETLRGRIMQINPAADPATRQFTVRVRLDNARNRIRPGMFGRVVLETERVRQAVVVPKEAVKQSREGGDAAVTIVTADNKAETRPVQTGLSDARGVAIINGLRPGEKVVILSGREIRDGQPLRVAGGKDRPGGAASRSEAASPATQGGRS